MKSWTNSWLVKAQLHASLKTQPSGMFISIKFDGYKLLEKQIDMLVEVMDKMNTGCQGRQNHQTILISLPFIEAKITECVPAMIEVMTDIEEI